MNATLQKAADKLQRLNAYQQWAYSKAHKAETSEADREGLLAQTASLGAQITGFWQGVEPFLSDNEVLWLSKEGRKYGHLLT